MIVRHIGGYRRLVAWMALIPLAACLLVACGDEEQDAKETDEGAQSAFNASPTAIANVPADVESETVAIRDGKIEPESVSGDAGQSFILTVQGDGQQHRFAIEGIVNETTINASGDTEVQFAIPEGGSSTHEILLDGSRAGTFQVTEAGNVPS